MSETPKLASVEQLYANTHLDIPRQLRQLAEQMEQGKITCRAFIATMVLDDEQLHAYAFGRLSRFEVAGIAAMGAHKIANTIDSDPMPE